MKAVLIWLIVILPLSWGVTRSVQKSLPLFGIESSAGAK
ncbi:MFS transporter small subunit [Prosthecobacter debontii]